jgi:hypothetical protein
MDTQLIIDLPDGLDDEELKDYLMANVEDLYPAMDLEVNDFDDRAQVDDVTITQIDLTSDSINIEYDVEYSAYHGCRDANYADADQREIAGERIGNKFIFDTFSPPPKRTTYEEF